MHLAFSSDNNYVPYLKTSILSAFLNNLESEVNIHILSNKIDDKNKLELESLIKSPHHHVFFYESSDIRQRLGNLEVRTIALSSYSRLFLAEILSTEIEKVIYMDCDALILSSLDELWNINIDDYDIAGVEDVVNVKFKTLLNIPINYAYVNAGMLVFNLKKIREENTLDKIKKFINNYEGEIPHHDQGIINYMFHKSCKVLHPKYNCMTPFFYLSSQQIVEFYHTTKYYDDESLKEAIENPVFVHFTPFFITRPWIKDCEHPLGKTYLDYYYKIEGNVLKEDKRSQKFKIISKMYKILPFPIFSFLMNVASKFLSRH